MEVHHRKVPGGLYVIGYCLVLGGWSGGRLARKLDHKKGRQRNRQLPDHRSCRCPAGRMFVSPVASGCLWSSRRDCRCHGGRCHSAFSASKNLANSHASFVLRTDENRYVLPLQFCCEFLTVSSGVLQSRCRRFGAADRSWASYTAFLACALIRN